MICGEGDAALRAGFGYEFSSGQMSIPPGEDVLACGFTATRTSMDLTSQLRALFIPARWI